MPTLYVGLGPRGRDVTKDDLLSRFDTVCRVRDVRMRGSTAFVDVETENDADRLVEAFNGTFIGEIRLVVDRSKGNPNAAPPPYRDQGRRVEKRGRSRTPERRRRSRSRSRSRSNERGRGDEQTLFIGLGPYARDLSDREIVGRLEEAAPVLRIRRRGLSIFVDVRNRSDSQRIMNQLNNTYIGKARMTVQPSREDRRVDDRRPGRDRRERRGRSRSRSPVSSRSYSSRSSSSRDSRRRHRHRRHRHESSGRHRSSRRHRSPSRSRSPSGSRRSASSRSRGSRSASARSSVSRH